MVSYRLHARGKRIESSRNGVSTAEPVGEARVRRRLRVAWSAGVDVHKVQSELRRTEAEYNHINSQNDAVTVVFLSRRPRDSVQGLPYNDSENISPMP